MKLIDTPDHKFHQFGPTDPNPSTRVTAEWLNALQDEIINVIRNLGKTEPDENNPAQLSQSILHFFMFGFPPIVVQIQRGVAAPTDVGFNLDQDGGYFYYFHGVCEQFGNPDVTVTAFELIAMKDSSTHQWNVSQKDFIPGKITPATFQVASDGALKALTTGWGSFPGKIHLVITSREKSV